MNQRQERRASIITGAEALIFFFLVYWGREFLDSWLATFDLSGAVLLLIRVAFFVAFVALAVAVDRFIFSRISKKQEK